jgi:D-arabinonate dehydratase
MTHSSTTDALRPVSGLDPRDLTIERFEVVPVRAPLARRFAGSHYSMTTRCTIITRVYTSGGIVGESFNGDTDAEQDVIVGIIENEIAPLLAGVSALRVERCWEAMLPPSYDILRDRSLALQAIGCVDSALWDAIGKALDIPLATLWGGYRDRMPAICIGGYYSDDEGDIERQITRYRELGFGGCKFKVGRLSPPEDARRTELARKAAGDDFVLMVDANQVFSLPEALSRGRVYQELGCFWFEEPLRADDHDGLAELADKLDLRVASGENDFGLRQFRDLFQRRAVDVVQPDLRRAGGATECLDIAATANAFGVAYASHGGGPHLHLLAAMPNAIYMESGYLPEGRKLQEGCIPLPEGPGFSRPEW